MSVKSRMSGLQFCPMFRKMDAGSVLDIPLNDNCRLSFGDGDDVYVRWDGTDLDWMPSTDDYVMKFGDGTTSFDIWVYGNAATNYMEFNAGDSRLEMKQYRMRFGTLSSSTPGSGLVLTDSITRALEVNTDDNNASLSTATLARAIAGRNMVYANASNEMWGIDGLLKWSGVAHTGNVHAGVVGRFETTGTCSTATGSGNTFVAGVMGRFGAGSGLTLGAGTYGCGVLAFYNTSATNDPTGEYTAAFLATSSDIAGTGNWDYGLYIDNDTGVCDIHLSSTAKGIEVGTFGTPVAWDGADEYIEIHCRNASATSQKPIMRVRCSPAASQAVTTGATIAGQFQAYGTDTSNVGALEAIEGHVGIKAACTIIADTGTMPNMRAAWFKIEDLGFDLTLTGDAASLCLGFQFNSGTTLTGNADWMFLAKEGSLTDPADAFVRVYDGAGGGWATNLFDIPASAPYSSTDISGFTEQGHLQVKVGGSTWGIPLYSLS